MWYFESINDFVSMGGHGFYVWLAYGVFALTMTVYALAYRRRKAALIKQLRKKISSKNHASTT
ncbi:MAG: heme exporter protein CcmD [Pseudomonadales bacterium]